MKKSVLLFLSAFFLLTIARAQSGFDNGTRALYLMDISRYIEWPADIMLPAEEFSIGVLSNQDDLYWDLENMAKTRKFIQGKPIRIYLFRDPAKIEWTNVLYVNHNEGHKLPDLLRQIKGKHTLLVSEGYEFRESMLNFIAVDGKPRFEVNEKLMNEEGLKVDEMFLALAVKTREDWEALFNVTDGKLQEEKEITRQQKILISEQDARIAGQLKRIALQQARLDSLDAEIRKKQDDIRQKQVVLVKQVSEIGKQNAIIDRQLAAMSQQKDTLARQQKDITQKQKQLTKKEALIKDRDSRIILQSATLKKQKLIISFISVLLVLFAGLIYFIYLNYRNKKIANTILEEKNRQITAQKEEIRQQRDIAELQRDQIAYQKKHITDSIEYAKRIQRAILPSLELFSDRIDHFVLYKPRDIVSGDFYWVDEYDHTQIIITADCTGHGVPGAFMSMLGISLLNEIVHNKGIHKPDEILNELRKRIIISLKQEVGRGDVKDGMDMTVCTIHYDTGILEFAGANNPLYLVRDSELIQLKGDKMPVAIHDRMTPFTRQEVKLKDGDTFYTFSDGYVDQFGGRGQKKFLSKNFRNVLMEIQDRSMYEQGVKLDEIFEEWRKEVEQVDDVTVIGVRY